MINYVKGDATKPIGDGKKIIVHCCNDIGAWGSGFVVALSKRWKAPEQYYRGWKECFPEQRLPLGVAQLVKVEPDIYVANMIGQRGVRGPANLSPIRYFAIADALDEVFQLAVNNECSIHGPRLGAGLAGGDWKKIENILENASENYDVPVTIYDFED